MACLSSEQRRLGDTPWITLTFQQIARTPPSPVKCFGIWSLPWPDTLCLLMYSGLPWLMPQCSMSQLAAEALKIFLLYRLFLQHWPVPSQETECEAGLAAREQQKKKSPPGVLPGVGVTCDGYRLCRAVAALWPWAEPIPTFLQRALQRVCMDMAPSFGFSAQQPQWCTFKIITRVRALSREGHPWCRLLIASGRIRGYVSKWKWCNVTSVRVDWRAFICKKRKALNWKMKGQDGPSFCWRENINSEVGSARWVKSGGWGWTAHISLNAVRPNLTYGPVTERRPSELLLYLLWL